MNSEKVKEIKKALEEQTQHKPINCSHSEYVEACGMYCTHRREFVADMGIKNGQTCENCNKFTATDKVKKYADILTLINDMESENERLTKENETLRNAKVIYETVDYCAEDLRKAEKRIAELEKELTNDRIFYKDGICYPMNCQGALKQFAERLKEKAKNLKLGSVEVSNFVWVNDIDETLKEF